MFRMSLGRYNNHFDQVRQHDVKCINEFILSQFEDPDRFPQTISFFKNIINYYFPNYNVRFDLHRRGHYQNCLEEIDESSEGGSSDGEWKN